MNEFDLVTLMTSNRKQLGPIDALVTCIRMNPNKYTLY